LFLRVQLMPPLHDPGRVGGTHQPQPLAGLVEVARAWLTVCSACCTSADSLLKSAAALLNVRKNHLTKRPEVCYHVTGCVIGCVTRYTEVPNHQRARHPQYFDPDSS
jgi:hypothetical protein